MTLLRRRKQETAASAGEKVKAKLEQFRKDYPKSEDANVNVKVKVTTP